jgi:integrase
MLIRRGRIWHTRIMFNGLLVQRTLRTRNRETAVNLEAVLRTSLIKGEFGIVESRRAPTLEEFEERLLPHLKANVAPRTYDFYKQNIAVLKRFGPLASSRLSSIDSSLIEKFIQFRLQEKVVPVTVNHSLRTLRRVLHLAKEWKIIRDVPRIKVLPGEHERDAVLSEDDISKLVDYIARTYPSSLLPHIILFLVDTGLRISEACGLRKEHIWFENRRPVSIRIVRGKSKYAKREIPLTPRASETLSACLNKSHCDFAFTCKGGKRPLTRHYPSEQFRVMGSAIGLSPDYVLHSTRHTFCTRLGKAGADAFTIQKLAGHSSIIISQRYVHADREIKEHAIRLLHAINQPREKPTRSGTIEI